MDTLTVILIVLSAWVLISVPVIRIVFYLISKNQQCGVISFESTEDKIFRNRKTLPFYGLLPFTYNGKWYWGKFVIVREIKVAEDNWYRIGSELETK